MGKWQPVTYKQALPIYEQRPDIWVDGFTMVRIRVAIKIVRKLWAQRPTGQSKASFSLWLLTWLDKQRKAGTPHLLHFEITRAAKDMMQGMTGEMMYAEMLRTRGGRAIHKVRYGGGKDWRS